MPLSAEEIRRRLGELAARWGGYRGEPSQELESPGHGAGREGRRRGCGAFLLLAVLGAVVVVLSGWPSILAVLGLILPLLYIVTSVVQTSMSDKPPSALGGFLGIVWFASFFGTIALFVVALVVELL